MISYYFMVTKMANFGVKRASDDNVRHRTVLGDKGKYGAVPRNL